MNVGIFTFHYADNYGAVLQAYALQAILREMGHDSSIINYRYSPTIPFRLRARRFVTRAAKRLVNGASPGMDLSPRAKAFHAFRNECLCLTPRVSDNDLIELAGQFDAFVVGSDQVWNANFWGHHCPAYFLEFCRNAPVRKISYAPCFGEPAQPVQFVKKLDALLHNFDSVSVRGDFACQLIEGHSSVTPVGVLDPTFLVSFDSLPENGHAYADCILVYSLSRKLAADIRATATKMKQMTGHPVVSIAPRDVYPWADQYCQNVSPQLFPRLIRDATCVLTSSYHGTVFAIKYERPFLCFGHDSRSVRLRDLLHSVGLSDRFIGGSDSSGASAPMHLSPAYCAVREIINARVEDSREFITKALNA